LEAENGRLVFLKGDINEEMRLLRLKLNKKNEKEAKKTSF
jgi:hypothetical protein